MLQLLINLSTLEWPIIKYPSYVECVITEPEVIFWCRRTAGTFGYKVCFSWDETCFWILLKKDRMGA